MVNITKAIIITVIFLVSLFFIITNLNKKICKDNVDLQIENENYKKDNIILAKVIVQIYRELCLLKLKNCPEEEFHNIPLELCDWLENLMKGNNGTT